MCEEQMICWGSRHKGEIPKRPSVLDVLSLDVGGEIQSCLGSWAKLNENINTTFVLLNLLLVYLHRRKARCFCSP